MQNIHFETGKQRFTINGDESKYIEFNPNDSEITARFQTAIDHIAEKQKEIDSLEHKGLSLEESIKINSELDRFVRNQIDYIFDGPISDTVFGNTSCMSTYNGEPFYERFLNAVLPIIKGSAESERKKSDQRIKKYVARYEKK